MFSIHSFPVRHFFTSFILLLFAVVLGGCATDKGPTLTLATGSTAGIYYPTAKKICELYNSTKQPSDIACRVHSGKGSALNLVGIKNKSFDLAVVHSYWAKNSFNGEKYRFRGNSNRKLRALVSFYSEPLTIIAKKNKNINTLKDLIGKKVDLGASNTLNRDLVNHLMEVKNWQISDFLSPTELRSGREKRDAFCSNEIDAVFYEVGHPSEYVRKMIQECGGKLIEMDSETIKQLVLRDKSLSSAQIPYKHYMANTKSVSSVAHRPLLVTSADLSDEAAYAFTKSVIENTDAFGNIFDAHKYLQKNKMGSSSIPIPLHEGAIRYLNEKQIPN